MRTCGYLLGTLLFITTALPAQAQFIANGSSKTTGAGAASSGMTMSSIFANTMAKPASFSGFSYKPAPITPLNVRSMLPNFSWMQNLMMGRPSTISGPSGNAFIQQYTPTSKKK